MSLSKGAVAKWFGWYKYFMIFVLHAVLYLTMT